MFVDKVAVHVEAGDGGDGALSFRHEKFISRGGPDGGDGGHGGDVIFVASRNQNTLATFRYTKQLKAESGKPGSQRRRHGKSGAHLEVAVPVGTVVKNGDQIVVDLVEDGQRAIVAKGGKGGFGNAHFVSSVRQAPRIVEKGEDGDSYDLELELKMIADVGIVGLPNAGKSTLLAHISNAKPEIANYPFTTLRPNLGVVDIDTETSLLFADIPGLIEGASEGKGLGDEFLRHIERTRVLVHLIDVYSDDVVRDYTTIQNELKSYKPVDLSERPQIVALNKTEGVAPKEITAKLSLLQAVVSPETPLMAVSAASGEGIKPLLYEIKAMCAAAQAAESEAAALAAEQVPVFQLPVDDAAWQVDEADGIFTVSGRKIERFATRVDMGSAIGEQRLRDIMKKMGIMQELRRRGAEPGHKIRIGDKGTIEF